MNAGNLGRDQTGNGGIHSRQTSDLETDLETDWTTEHDQTVNGGIHYRKKPKDLYILSFEKVDAEGRGLFHS